MNIENIKPEIVVLMVGILVATIIIVAFIRGNSARRAKLRQDLEMLESARVKGTDLGDFESFNIKKENPLLINAALLLQVIVGIGLLIGFSWWTYYLIQKGLAGWGILTGIFVLIGLVMSLNAWAEIKGRKKDREQLIQGMEGYKKTLMKEVEAPVVETEIPVSEVERSMTAEPQPILREKESAVQSGRWLNLEDMIQHYAGIDKNGKIPQDSTLRRHYLTNLLAEIESGLTARPTDSALRRHYDALIDVEVENRLLENSDKQSLQVEVPVAKVQEEPSPATEAISQQDLGADAKPDAGKIGKLKIPEDSMLRRHFLSHLRIEIESRMPIRPTDSALRRHYDAMIDTEIANLAE